MKTVLIIAGVALLATFFIGCSKPQSSNVPPNLAMFPPNKIYLGPVELTPKTPKQFSLGDGKGCSITGRQLSDSVEVKLLFMVTNTDGTVNYSAGEIETAPGQRCGVSVGDTLVSLTPTIKSP